MHYITHRHIFCCSIFTYPLDNLQQAHLMATAPVVAPATAKSLSGDGEVVLAVPVSVPVSVPPTTGAMPEDRGGASSTSWSLWSAAGSSLRVLRSYVPSPLSLFSRSATSPTAASSSKESEALLPSPVQSPTPKPGMLRSKSSQGARLPLARAFATRRSSLNDLPTVSSLTPESTPPGHHLGLLTEESAESLLMAQQGRRPSSLRPSLVTPPPSEIILPLSDDEGVDGGDPSLYPNPFPVVFIDGFFGSGTLHRLCKPFLCSHTPPDLHPKTPMTGASLLGLPHSSRKPRLLFFPALGSVSSLHDRTCELFYYIKGGTVDYGEEHSKAFGHKRFGRSYTGLYPEWSESNPINLLGHSLGGITCRLLQQVRSTHMLLS
jgi:hypothetical protein